MTKNTVAYVYRWTHIPTGKWYIGSRSRKGCNPRDGYLCSSKIVRPMIIENRHHWDREILLIGDPLYVVMIEALLLNGLDAKNDPNSFNLQNGDGKWTTAGKTMPCSESKRKNISKSRKGKATIEKGKVIVITNGVDEIRIPVNSVIPDGWLQGRSDAAKEGMSKSQEGVPKPSVSKSLTGRSLTESHKLNTKEGIMRWKQSMSEQELKDHYSEVGNKISKSKKGIRLSSTHIENISKGKQRLNESLSKEQRDSKYGSTNRGRSWIIVDGKRTWIDREK